LRERISKTEAAKKQASVFFVGVCREYGYTVFIRKQSNTNSLRPCSFATLREIFGLLLKQK
jgi:hypothetical protein